MQPAKWPIALTLISFFIAPSVYAGGWAVVDQTLSDSSTTTLLPAGSVTVSMKAGISLRLLAADSNGNFKHDSISFFTYDAGAGQTCRTTAIVPAVSEFRLCLETNGSVSIQRTAGPTINVVMRIMWIKQPS